ncbi:hypothetical protein [Pantoea sp.]|uniref:hypothetical protein n=1 Tax=Pantoea sp. TaxID=69393 RepID=UPI0031DA7FE9
MDINVYELALGAARNVLGQAVINLLEDGIPITNESMIEQLASMHDHDQCITELAMHLFGVTMH